MVEADWFKGLELQGEPFQVVYRGWRGRRAAGADSPWRICTREGENTPCLLKITRKIKTQKSSGSAVKGRDVNAILDETAHNSSPFLKQ